MCSEYALHCEGGLLCSIQGADGRTRSMHDSFNQPGFTDTTGELQVHQC